MVEMTGELKLQVNENRCAFIEHEHGLSFVGTCPVSGNPRLGSSVTICYKANDWFLEVASLKDLVDSYKGGKGDVRSMEGMLQEIAQLCADALKVDVTLHSFLLLDPDQIMRIKCYAFPK
jgi:NADPH-dependent 7-cyano-7-deazaguanine reductase QueF